MSITEYNLVRCIGAGGFGEVYLGQKILCPRKFFAIKIQKRPKNDEKSSRTTALINETKVSIR